MVRIKFEDVGVHLEYEQVACNLQLGFEFASVAVLYSYTFVQLAIQVIIQLRCNLKQYVFQLVKRRKRIVENVLLKRRFVDYRRENFLAHR